MTEEHKICHRDRLKHTELNYSNSPLNLKCLINGCTLKDYGHQGNNKN